MLKKRKLRSRLIFILVSVFLLMNLIAFFHAYKFTHFSRDVVKTKNPEKLSTGEKLKTLLLGVNNPRPVNKTQPSQHYTAFTLQSNKKISCWYIPVDSAVGNHRAAKRTMVLFHGYSADKSTMQDKADEFLAMGYNAVLVDFMGSGESEGDQTTIGFKEADEVKTVFDYLTAMGEKNIYLFGTSMGAAAVMKAINDYRLSPKAIIIECPFGSMYQTVCARFRNMHAPTFPMASLLVFWGGIQNGFWAFGHNPTEYAKGIRCPTLLIYGEQDKNVSRAETDGIYNNLAGPKKLKLIKYAGHENFLTKHRDEWLESVSDFLKGD